MKELDDNLNEVVDRPEPDYPMSSYMEVFKEIYKVFELSINTDKPNRQAAASLVAQFTKLSKSQRAKVEEHMNEINEIASECMQEDGNWSNVFRQSGNAITDITKNKRSKGSNDSIQNLTVNQIENLLKRQEVAGRNSH